MAEAPGGAHTLRSDPGSGPPSERNQLRPAGGAPTTPPSHLRLRGRKPTREPGRPGARARERARRGYTRPPICYHHSAGTAAAGGSGARPFSAAGTATQPQERLRDALAIIHVLRAQKRRQRLVLPVGSAGRDDASRRPRGPADEVDHHDGQALGGAQVLSLSRVREDQAAVLLPGNDREQRGCEGRPHWNGGREWGDDDAAQAVRPCFRDECRQQCPGRECENALPVQGPAVRAAGAAPIRLRQRVDPLRERLRKPREELLGIRVARGQVW
jgi:hypothetical protein